MSATIQSSCCCFHRPFGTELTLTLKLEHSDPLTQRDHRCTKESKVVLDPNSAVPSTAFSPFAARPSPNVASGLFVVCQKREDR